MMIVRTGGHAERDHRPAACRGEARPGRLPEIKAEFARTARITVGYPSVDELQRFMRSEIVRLGKVVEQAGIARSQ